MRIAYIAPYQGMTYFKMRPSLYNLGLAANLKIELISELLDQGNHSVELISQGEVVERQWKFYPAFGESKPFHANIPVHYASALPLRFVNGFWSAFRVLNLFKKKHQEAPFDLVIIYNLKLPQMICAIYAIQRLCLPIILEFEDDASVDIAGESENGFSATYHLYLARKILSRVSGCIGVSPHLLSRFPPSLPRLLLRGVVSDEIIEASRESARKNWVVYSGTHTSNKGLGQLITAWQALRLPHWELHIAGYGEQTAVLEKMAQHDQSIVFHGLLSRQENARLLSVARIGINPHDLSRTPGNIFAFKIIEYLAAGVHVVTTPMGVLESELEVGITYMHDNAPETICETLRQIVQNGDYKHTAVKAAQNTYGPTAVASSLDKLLQQVVSMSASPQ